MAKNESVIGLFRKMEVGDTLDFPAAKLSYIRASASLFGAEWDKTFSTHFDRDERKVFVTRTR